MTIKQLIKKTIIFIVLLVLSDFVVGKIISHLYFSQTRGGIGILNATLEKQEADIVIIGSSRANHHYNPNIISDSLNLSCYNAGKDGQSILYHKAIIDVLLERYLPKIIILDLQPEDFFIDRGIDVYARLKVLGPYVENCPVLWKTLTLISRTERIKHFSSIYPYNSTLLKLKWRKKEISNSNGYIPIKGVYDKDIEEADFSNIAIDKCKENTFRELCLMCKGKRIRIIVSVSPSYRNFVGHNSSLDFAKSVCDSLSIPFFDYTNNPYFKDNLLFKDPRHLNKEGSTIFSEQIAHIVKSLNESNE